ncbi:MAG: hypothetical protein B9S26_00835 [Opitutia bacterium Tous-C4FEB]|nr:MAG: hypothetical protein B9S35_00835 [Opitutae bacterium Tous-C5TDCM]PAW91247.1 MAG: hypothetical protein B9S26_00835 [Opitutae bacterium Tous-C4FEB]
MCRRFPSIPLAPARSRRLWLAAVLSPLLFATTFLPAAEPAQNAAPAAPQPIVAKNWSLPLFTKEGHRSMTLRGTEARTVNPTRIDITDLNITTFAGDAAAKVESILLCRELASFYPDEKLVRGTAEVRLMRDDLEITGEQWIYDHGAKKVSIARNTRITFKAQLPDLLK